MDPLSLSQLAEIVEGDMVEPTTSGLVVHDVTVHSDRIRQGSVFFALSGAHTDGHRFVPAAFRNGALAAVVARSPNQVSRQAAGPLIQVDDPLRALQRLAAWWRSQITSRVVAVAGSNGKTVTKDALAHFASYRGSVYGSPGSHNTELGVPLAVLGCPKHCDLAVIEVATAAPDEMAAIEKIVRPDHVILTNLGSLWQSRFEDRRHLAAELTSIAANLQERSWLLVGREGPELLEAAQTLSCERLLFNHSERIPTFSAPRRHPDGLEVDALFPGQTGPRTILIRTPSEEILADVELALAASFLLGADATTLVSAAHEYAPTSTRMEIWRSPGGITIIRDAATVEPLAVRSALRAAKRINGNSGRCLAVLAGQLPVADAQDLTALAAVFVAQEVDAVLGLDTPAHQTVAEAVRAADPTASVRLFADPTELRQHLSAELRMGDVAVIQSPPERSISDVATGLIEAMAPARLYLHLEAIEENVRTFRHLVGPSVRIMGMVKALAYGTDLISVAAWLREAGVDSLAVASADEGAALRRAGISLPLLILLGTSNELEKMLRHQLTPLIYSSEMLNALLALPADGGRAVTAHLEVDSGMHRTGLQPDQAIEALRQLRTLPNVTIEGLMTHLACAENPAEDEFTLRQLSRFDRVVEAARTMGFNNLTVHAANTAATIRFPGSRHDMVRIGLGLYGIHLSPATRQALRFEPSVGLVSRIIQISDLEAGERVGYGGTFTAPEGGRRIGVAPVGYHDGIPRALSNIGQVIVAGVQCPIVGTISMDSMTIDLSNCPEAQVGSDVLIYGRHNDWLIKLEEISESAGTISHELMSRVGPRVQRIFTRH